MIHLFTIILYPTSISYEPRAPDIHNSIANGDLLSFVIIIGTKCPDCLDIAGHGPLSITSPAHPWDL